MVDWLDPTQLQRESGAYIRLRCCFSRLHSLTVAFVNVIFVCFGLYIWEVFQTSDFELSILQRRRKLRWHWVSCLASLSFAYGLVSDYFSRVRPLVRLSCSES